MLQKQVAQRVIISIFLLAIASFLSSASLEEEPTRHNVMTDLPVEDSLIYHRVEVLPTPVGHKPMLSSAHCFTCHIPNQNPSLVLTILAIIADLLVMGLFIYGSSFIASLTTTS